MKLLSVSSRWFFLLLLAAIAIGLTGCATTDEPDNASARPWNQPARWETGGLPSSMTEPGR